MNPNLTERIICLEKHNLNEVHKIAFVCFSAHFLVMETGRWNRRGRGRIPVDTILCRCDKVQTKDHVMTDCPLSCVARNVHSVESIHDIFSGAVTDADACIIICNYQTLRIYAWIYRFNEAMRCYFYIGCYLLGHGTCSIIIFSVLAGQYFTNLSICLSAQVTTRWRFTCCNVFLPHTDFAIRNKSKSCS